MDKRIATVALSIFWTLILLVCTATAHDNVGAIRLTFKFRYMNQRSKRLITKGRKIVEKPAGGVRIVFWGDFTKTNYTANDDGVIRVTDLRVGFWTLDAVAPPPDEEILAFISGGNSNISEGNSKAKVIDVRSTSTVEEVFYIILDESASDARLPHRLNLNFKLYRTASFNDRPSSTDTARARNTDGRPTSARVLNQKTQLEKCASEEGKKKVSGSVVDSEKQPVAGALVEAHALKGKAPATFIELDSAITDKQGNYTLCIPAGGQFDKYLLSISHRLFYPQSRVVKWNDQPPSVITLETKNAVSESASAVTRSFEPARRSVFLPQLMQTLPVPGLRSFDYFGLLAPGVLPPPETVGSAGPGVAPAVGTAGQFTVNGIRSRENNFTVDGSDNNDEDIGTRRQGFVLLTPQPVESLQEFQIITALADARFGRNAGGQVNALTQVGSYGLHGQAYGFFTHDRLNARNFFDQVLERGSNTVDLRRTRDKAQVFLDNQPLVVSNPVGGEDKLTRSQGGLILGGHFKPLDTYFFGSFERLAVRATPESHFAVPKVAQRGIFGTGETGAFKIFEITPGHGMTFRYFPASIPGNAIFSLYPFPNNPRGPYGGNTYSAVLPADAEGTRFSGKLSKQIGISQPERKFKFRHFLWIASGDAVTGRYNLIRVMS